MENNNRVTDLILKVEQKAISKETKTPLNELEPQETDIAEDKTKLLEGACQEFARLAGFMIAEKTEKDFASADTINVIAKIESNKNPNYSKFSNFVNELKLSEKNKNKLIEMMSEANWQQAIDMAKKVDPNCKISADLYEKTINELIKYSPERLAKICAEMKERSVIQIKTDNQFNEKINNMNKNKHYTSKNGEKQDDAFVVQGKDEPYRKMKKCERAVMIVDGTPRPKDQAGAPHTANGRREYEIERLKNKNMELIDPDDQAILMQRTLREAEQKGDNSVIIDNWEDGNGTVTILNPKNLAKSQFVAFSDFDSGDRQAFFGSLSPNSGGDYLRGRASVQVLKF